MNKFAGSLVAAWAAVMAASGAADAAQPDHRHAQRTQPRIAGVAVEPAQAAEAAFEIGGIARRQRGHRGPAVRAT